MRLAALIRSPEVERTIVFARTKRGADRVAENLAKDGLRAEVIHGNKAQNARQKALNLFRAGQVRVLVATDIVARGIDVPGITHIINYDLPDEPGMTGEFDFRLHDGPIDIGPFRIEPRRVVHPVPAYALKVTADGRSLVYSGDTGPCSALDDVAAGAHLLLAEASFQTGDDNPPDLHLTGADCGRTAAKAGVERLVLTHVPPWHDAARAEAEARAAWYGPVALARAGATYALEVPADERETRDFWAGELLAVAVDADDPARVLGAAKAGPNRPAQGSHVGTASFMVAASARGRGVGRLLGEHVVAWHREAGYAAIQFNAVVSTIIGDVEVPSSCYPNPNPVLTTTTIR